LSVQTGSAASDVEGNGPLSELPHVWQPLDIGPISVEHRVMVTGHSQLFARDHLVSDRHVDYYAERARGGAALLILEQQAVHPSGMNYHAGCIAYDPAVVPHYRELAEAVHAHGTRQFVQLFAGGSQGSGTMYLHNFHPLWAVSRVPSVIYNEMPMVMEQRHIDELIEGFVRSAENVRDSGLDGVEIHAAHNQCVAEFLSPAYNRRDDQYGGSLENRCRLLVEIGQAVRRRVGDSIAVGVRMSFDEFHGDVGITPEDSEAQLEVLCAADLFDFFDISCGGYHTLHRAVPPMGSAERGFMEPYARRARAVVAGRAKIFLVGRVLDVAHADRIIGEGSSDMVAMTRAHMADPDLVSKSRAGHTREITRCVGANVCIRRLAGELEIGCVVNPAMGREREFGHGTLKPATAPERIAVVGGGPAGLRFAATAARRGHDVVVFERDAQPGGHLRILHRLPTRESWKMALDDLVNHAQDAGVQIRSETEATAKLLESEGFSTVVCATGSRWQRSGETALRPDRPEGIPGAAGPGVYEIEGALALALEDPAVLGQRILIYDESDGYLPFGLAEILLGAGAEVEIVTPHLYAGSELGSTLDMPYVLPRLKAAGLRVSAQEALERIDAGTVELHDIWGGGARRVEMDSVVLAMQREPVEDLYLELAGCDWLERLERVGDVIAPRRLEALIFEAEALARDI
jgi:2,4-dienoyl-CoA reductase-like NADH-dependent reductase (Old Yellow Enzyme family)